MIIFNYLKKNQNVIIFSFNIYQNHFFFLIFMICMRDYLEEISKFVTIFLLNITLFFNAYCVTCKVYTFCKVYTIENIHYQRSVPEFVK